MTPWEVSLFVECEAVRAEERWERTAWQTAYLLNVHVRKGKPRMTVDKLLGRVITVTDGAQARAHMERLRVESLRDAGRQP